MARDYDDQQTLLGVLLKIKKSDPTLTLVSAVVILCERLDIDIETFMENCGDIVLDRIKKDAIDNHQIRGFRNKSRDRTVKKFFNK